MTEYSENNFEQCIKCTVCTVYCPAAAANPLFPGPKQAGPDGEPARLYIPSEGMPLLDRPLTRKKSIIEFIR